VLFTLVVASTRVRGSELVPIRSCTEFNFSITVPCNFNVSTYVYFGEKGFRISPATFNLGPISEGSDRCLAGAAASLELTGGKLAFDNFWGQS
jgi:hypothetical protein